MASKETPTKGTRAWKPVVKHGTGPRVRPPKLDTSGKPPGRKPPAES